MLGAGSLLLKNGGVKLSHSLAKTVKNGEDRHEIELWAVDGVGMFWEFRCAVRQQERYKKPVLQSDGWLKFVNYKGLVAGDVVILKTIENQFRGTRFMPRALKYDTARQ
ncbi:hypothetical protein TIFTF001_011369 [Ficus carica]|uniref:TF-B3 domain-containing protein n=1 Tax=Ficus carica TaxID=3494 RepID=A0AA87ZX21_FICCA|nr:hypothetical protein TIFTF001_011369 [Ficus carica]